MNITDFLLARIAEDEAMARDAYDHDAWELSADDDGDSWVIARDRTGEGWRVAMAPPAPAIHMVNWDPARVLAECAAKGAIVAAHEAYAQEAIESTGIAFVGARVGQQATGDILRTLAAVYANHPGYRAEWAIHQGGWRG